VDTIGELFRTGVIDRSGTIRTDLSHPRIQEVDGERAFVLVHAEQSATGRDILISQSDITNLIRSKGAIYTATKTLTTYMGLALEDIERFYIGGGFGNYLNIEGAIWIGLLPDLDREKFVFIGNSSLAGARMPLLSHEAMEKTHQIAEKMTYVELSVDTSYMQEYVASLFLPHTDIDLFPTVARKLQLRIHN